MAKGPFSSKVRLTFLRCMEALGTTASNLASNAKLKAAEINLENRRREILTNFSLRAFELWQKGEKLPDSLSEMLSELSDIEGKLSVLRAQKYAKVPQPDAAKPSPDEGVDASCAAEAAEDEPENGDDSIPVACTVSDDDGESGEPVSCALDDRGPEDGSGDVSAEPESDDADASSAEEAPFSEEKAADPAPDAKL